MSKLTDIQIKQVEVEIQQLPYRTPIKFGGRVVTDAVLLNIRATVETASGKQAVGYGSMPMGNVWSWPTSEIQTTDTMQAMVELGKTFAHKAPDVDASGHPLEVMHELSASLSSLANQTLAALNMGNHSMPRLAQLVAASPLEAAVYDGYGKALEANSYNLLGKEFVNSDLERYLGNEFQGEYLDQYTSRTPQTRMPLYHLVGALDPLEPADVSAPVNDGLPESLDQWILKDELDHLKIKLNGDDLDWDVKRVCAIDRISEETQALRNCAQWFYSLDFNERCASVDYVLSFLQQLREYAPKAFDRVQYIEQPTHRDLAANPQNQMHAAAKIKPVVIDESLIDLHTLHLSREMGYSGVALKACKGHSEALLMGAAAQKYNMFLCVQDLTCPGASFLHSASLAARIPTIRAIEGNGRQYCPAGNLEWEKRFPSMFQVRQGSVETQVLVGPGLGF